MKLKKINVLTLFPNFIETFLNYSIIKRYKLLNNFNIKLINFRDYAKDGRVDDYIYGGSPGMLLKCNPIHQALKKNCKNSHVIVLSPEGKIAEQNDIVKWINNYKNITFICGHYEGFDYRVFSYANEVISVGNLIVSGGETPVILLLDAIIRQLPKIINKYSLLNESFSILNNFLIEPEQYTRPKIFLNHEVPKVLLNGNHKEISIFNKNSSESRTKLYLNRNKFFNNKK